MNNLQETFGNIDIYLFDQLLKGRFDHCKKVIDVGCGSGRNIVYFLQQGVEVFGVDQNPEAIADIRALSCRLAPQLPAENFQVATITAMPFPPERFDLAICSAVLHFAHDPEHFEAMVQSIWRVLKPGGFFFSRLASNIGIEKLVQEVGNGRYLLPDGTERFLVDQAMLLDFTEKLHGELYEPIKTTNVQNLRSMTTWCMQKSNHSS